MSGKAWHEKVDMEWMKVHESWWTSSSHIGLKPIDFHVGLRCMSIANRRGRQVDGSGEVLDGSGKPLSLSEIARLSACGKSACKKALYRLVSVGTLVIKNGTTFCFPNLQKWQEDPSTKRKRLSEFHSESPEESPEEIPAEIPRNFTSRRSDEETSKRSDQIFKKAAEPTEPATAPARPTVDPLEKLGLLWNQVPELEPCPYVERYRSQWGAIELQLARGGLEAGQAVERFIEAARASRIVCGLEGDKPHKWPLNHLLRMDRFFAVLNGEWSSARPQAKQPKLRETPTEKVIPCPPPPAAVEMAKKLRERSAKQAELRGDWEYDLES